MFDAVPGPLVPSVLLSAVVAEPEERSLAVCYHLVGEASPGLLPRVLELVAKRGLVPERVRADRDEGWLRVALSVVLPEGVVPVLAGQLRALVGVARLEVEHGRVMLRRS